MNTQSAKRRFLIYKIWYNLSDFINFNWNLDFRLAQHAYTFVWFFIFLPETKKYPKNFHQKIIWKIKKTYFCYCVF